VGHEIIPISQDQKTGASCSSGGAVVQFWYYVISTAQTAQTETATAAGVVPEASATEQLCSTGTTSFQHEALSAIDLNADGTRLTATLALNGPDRLQRLVKFGEEIKRLLSSGTGVFIRRVDVPAGKIVAYYNPQLKYKMKNGDLVMRVRGTIGGDQLPYDGPTAAETAALEVMRLLLNALVSEGANLMTLDTKNFYLGTPLDEPENSDGIAGCLGWDRGQTRKARCVRAGRRSL
jgi:hypothetical protein